MELGPHGWEKVANKRSMQRVGHDVRLVSPESAIELSQPRLSPRIWIALRTSFIAESNTPFWCNPCAHCLSSTFGRR